MTQPGVDLSEGFPAVRGEKLSGVFEQVETVDHGIGRVFGEARVHEGFQAGEIEPETVLVDDESDFVEVGFQSRVQHEAAVDRLLELRVALFEQGDLLGLEGDEGVAREVDVADERRAGAPPRAVAVLDVMDGVAGGTRAGRHFVFFDFNEAEAVEAFEDGDHLDEAVILGAQGFETRFLGGVVDDEVSARTPRAGSAADDEAGVGVSVELEPVGDAHAGDQIAELVAVFQRGFAGGLQGGSIGPVFDQGVNGFQHLGAGRAGEALDEADERHVERGGFAQVAHRARSLHVGQAQGFVGQRESLGEFAVEGVFGEVEVADAARGAVGAGVGAGGGLRVAVAEVFAGGGAGEADAGDAGLGKGNEFALVGDAVLVEVAPNLDVGVLGVGAVELAVVVGIEVGERGEAVGGPLAVTQCRVGAEEFAAVVDRAVAVAVEHEQGVVALDPTGAGLDAVAVVVEENGAVAVDAGGFKTVAVEVEGQGVDGGRCPAAGAEVGVVGGGVDVRAEKFPHFVADFQLPMIVDQGSYSVTGSERRSNCGHFAKK